MQRKTTALYWALVHHTMQEEGCSQSEAELLLVITEAVKYRMAGWSHYQIGTRLQAMWGLNRSTYWRRLKKARQTVCIL